MILTGTARLCLSLTGPPARPLRELRRPPARGKASGAGGVSMLLARPCPEV